MRPLLFVILMPAALFAQTYTPLTVKEKLTWPTSYAFSPLSLVGEAAYAGILHWADSPREWGQGAKGYGKRFGSTVAGAGINGAIGLGLDTVLHEAPRYFRSES